MDEKKVYSITINNKNDCVILTDAEAMLVKIKYHPDIRMYDMTALHGYDPYTYKKEERERTLSDVREMALEGVKWNGFRKVFWTAEDLLSGNI